MKNIFVNLKLPVIISSIAVLPFLLLELINRRNLHEDFPIPLFGILWILPVAFILILMPVIQKVRAGKDTMVHSIYPFLGVLFLIIIAWLWVSIVRDQMPCFLGVPNCD